MGETTVAEESAILLVGGWYAIVQAYVRASLFASVLAAAVRVTVTVPLVRVTVCAGPALATGAELAADAVTVMVLVLLLSNLPSFTTKLAT